MSSLMHILIATTTIAGLILFRIFAERLSLREKLRGNHANGDCEQIGCFRGCDLEETAPDPHSVSEQKTPDRSANHAH